MSTLFKCAQRWELIEDNPMQLVRVKNVSRRLERPSVLTPEEFHKVLPHLRQPYRTMILIAGYLGLRASEMGGLQWRDFDFEKSTLLVQRGIVHGRVDDVKTEYSRDVVPIAPELAKEFVGVSRGLLPVRAGLPIRQSCDGSAIPPGGNPEEAHPESGQSGGHHVPSRLENVQAQLSLMAGPDRRTDWGPAGVDASREHSDDDELVWQGDDRQQEAHNNVVQMILQASGKEELDKKQQEGIVNVV